jgi:gamma-glutamyltranspeptidase/glutathione hydrolase
MHSAPRFLRSFQALALLRASLAGLAATLLVACATPGVGRESANTAPPRASAALAMPDSFSAAVASDVLARQGNAVDAAVAAAFTLAVTYPEAGNIGGGGFMLTWMDGQAAFLDYREVAPAAASRDMYLDERGDVAGDASLTGQRAAGVPGTVAGLWEAHRRYGRLPWRDLLAPAIRLAADGFPVPPQLADRMREELPRLAGHTNFSEHFGAMRAGEVFRQPQLAATLRRIQAAGAADFYRGETATLIAAEMRRGGGLIASADLRRYQVIWRDPLEARWRDYRVLAAPPPSSGGFAVIQLLKMKDALAPAFAGVTLNSPQYVHLVAEMEKRVFADRAEYLGDPAFVDVPVKALIDDRYIASRAATVNLRAISPVTAAPPGLEPHATTHFSIVDRWGNVVANTYTLNTDFGSGVVVSGAGFLLNNEMDDFSVKPGAPNFYGVVGSSANSIEPGKRMLSSMSPTILLRDGKVGLVLGTPGGSTIITSVFQTIVDILDFGLSPQDAVGAARFHHQLLPPDLVTYSPAVPLSSATIDALARRGYRVTPHDWEIGDVQVIWRDGTEYRAASDPRGRGEARVLH